MARINDIAAFVLQHNPFFVAGFGSAWRDDETGYIWATENGERRPVFPDDRLSDYFYLRPLRNGVLEADRQLFPPMGCTATGIIINAPYRLVAAVSNAMPELLAQRLINVLGLFSPDLRLTAFDMVAETVLLEEMRYAENEDVAAALQRLSGALVAVDFVLRSELTYQPLNCLTDICEPC